MLNRVSEPNMRRVRWVLTVGWIILIISLFYDPISAFLTDSATAYSPFRDSETCILVQGECLDAQWPYPIGTRIFWGMVVPSAIMFLLVFGHEAWRRICPLYFLSQIPRSLGFKPQLKVKQNKWLISNHFYLQFILFFIGITFRLLFVNSDRLVLALFLIATILTAITTVYLYGGRSWCHYVCPFGAVQTVFTGPRGLLDSQAHTAPPKIATQSMCRTFDQPKKQDKIDCVGCKTACFDIDAEKTYWTELDKPGRKLVQYGYLGIVIGYVSYYFLYAGNWNYYFSGIWTHETHQLGALFKPGLYLSGHPIAIPKLVAAPVVLGIFVFASYWIGMRLEKLYVSYLRRQSVKDPHTLATHHLFSLVTFLSFNIFFIYGGRPEINRFPATAQFLFEGVVVLVSSLWLYRTWNRSNEVYNRESLADKLRRQLAKLQIDFSKFLEGRSMESLKPDEVYVLAKVLPNFNKENSLQVYKGVLRESLEQGNVNSSNSLEVLTQMRQGLGVQEEEHFKVLTELGIEDPELLNPTQQRTRENQLRLESYRQALESQLLELVQTGISPRQALKSRDQKIQAFKQQYSISPDEESQILQQIYGENSTLLRTAESLLMRLGDLAEREWTLKYPSTRNLNPVFDLLQAIAVYQKQEVIIQQLLNILEILGPNPDSIKIAQIINTLGKSVLQTIFNEPSQELMWQEHLHPDILEDLKLNFNRQSEAVMLKQKMTSETSETLSLNQLEVIEIDPIRDPRQHAIEVLIKLVQEIDPLVKAASLHALTKIDLHQAREQARIALENLSTGDWLVYETAGDILSESIPLNYQEAQTVTVKVNNAGKSTDLTFQQPVVRIGKESFNEIVLNAPNIAPQHAMLYLDDQGVSIVDLDGAVGLTLEHHVLRNDRQRLQQGEVIRFGNLLEPSLIIQWNKRPVLQTVPTVTIGTIDKLLLLFQTRFFGSIQPQDLIELAKTSQVCIYGQGETICFEGDLANEILLLFDGAADVVIQQGDREQRVNHILAGETIGELGVLTRQKRSATVIATETSYVLMIKAEDFERVLRQNPELSRHLLLLMSKRMQRMTTEVKGKE